MHLPYVIGSYLLFLLMLPMLLLHPKLRDGWSRRLGLYSGRFPEEEAGGSASRGVSRAAKGESRRQPAAELRVWFHGASAGDLSALAPMIFEVRRLRPGARLIVSCLTNSGAVMARKRLGCADGITYQPWDLPGATRRAVDAIRPDILVLEYTEIWPNLIRAARRAGARIVMTNGRFSERKIFWYKLLFALSGRPLESLDLMLMRTEEEAERALALGAPEEIVKVTGNTKFDALLVGNGKDPQELRRAFALDSSSPVLVAGSTHEGEESMLLEVYRRLLETVPDLRLVLAPRYLERVSRVVSLIERAGFRSRRRSAAGSDEGRKRPADDGAVAPVGVLDTIGELVTCYRLASVVFVGGSFTKRGGQNILEPAAQGRPVIFGPNMANFRDSVQVLIGRGGIQVADGEKLHKVLVELFERPEKLVELGELASETVRGIRGASERNVEAMLDLLEGEGFRDRAAGGAG
ncbi:MAG: 3-deoxy-D-manno-octulosonic acid transferase [Myxococcota bacterium]